MEVSYSKDYRNALWLGFVLLLLVAGATAKYVPEFQGVFSAFGAELPMLTRFVLNGPIFIWILPIITALLLASAYRNRKAKWGALIFLIVLGLAWVPTAVVGLYLPIAESAETAFDERANKSFKPQAAPARTGLRPAA